LLTLSEEPHSLKIPGFAPGLVYSNTLLQMSTLQLALHFITIM